MPDVSHLKVGSTTYDIKDASASGSYLFSVTDSLSSYPDTLTVGKNVGFTYSIESKTLSYSSRKGITLTFPVTGNYLFLHYSTAGLYIDPNDTNYTSYTGNFWWFNVYTYTYSARDYQNLYFISASAGDTLTIYTRTSGQSSPSCKWSVFKL